VKVASTRGADQGATQMGKKFAEKLEEVILCAGWFIFFQKGGVGWKPGAAGRVCASNGMNCSGISTTISKAGEQSS